MLFGRATEAIWKLLTKLSANNVEASEMISNKQNSDNSRDPSL